MNLLKGAGKVLGALFGGGGGGDKSFATVAVERYSEHKDKSDYTEQEQAQDQAQDLASAREYQPDNMPSIVLQQGILGGLVNGFIALSNNLVDAVNHLIRPGIVVWLIGGFVGQWSLPNPEAVDPRMWLLFERVMLFWFGGRALAKDIPAIIAGARKLMK